MGWDVASDWVGMENLQFHKVFEEKTGDQKCKKKKKERNIKPGSVLTNESPLTYSFNANPTHVSMFHSLLKLMDNALELISFQRLIIMKNIEVCVF